MPFKNLGLVDELIKALTEKGYTKPTPIQEQAIPVILEGSDLMAGSQTGTGKTAGFTLPLLQRLSRGQKNQTNRPVRALILTPTRELAAQVAESVVTYGKYLSLKAAVIFGGVGIHAQIKELRSGVDIIIATPGRLLDHVSQKTVDLSKIEVLVLDEADRMLDMGFIHDIRRLLALLPKTRQNLLFSATFSSEIKALADGLLNSPKKIEVARHNTAAEGVTQVVYPVDSKRKRALLSHLILSEDLKQILVFTRTKHGANRLSEQLSQDGITATAIHGNKSQSARTKALADFKQGTVRVLVATDIAARGLDIDQLPHVVNYELPNVPEDYVHRIGRTGRAGNFGKAISLVCIDEHGLLRDIERLLKRSIESVTLPGYEPDPSIRAEPIPNGRPQSRGPQLRNSANKSYAPKNHEPRDHVSKEHSDKKPSSRTNFSRPTAQRQSDNRTREDRSDSSEPGAVRQGRGYQSPRSHQGNGFEGPSRPQTSRFGSNRSDSRGSYPSRSGNGNQRTNFQDDDSEVPSRPRMARPGAHRSDSRGQASSRPGNGYQGNSFEEGNGNRQAPSRFGANRPSSSRFGTSRPDSNRSGNTFDDSSRSSPSRFGPSRPSANRFGPKRPDSNRSGNSFEDSSRSRSSPSRFGARRPSGDRPNASRFGATRPDSNRSGNSFEGSSRGPSSSRFGVNRPSSSRPSMGRSDERGTGPRGQSSRGPNSRGPNSGRPSSGRPGSSNRPSANNRSEFDNY